MQSFPKKRFSGTPATVAKSSVADNSTVHVPTKHAPPDDKWATLRAFCKSKGLCFICGGKWSRDHQYKSSVQLHFVQELIDHLDSSSTDSNAADSYVYYEHVMSISEAALGTTTSLHTIKLSVQLHGKQLLFLVDSGNTTFFLHTPSNSI